MPPSTLRPAGDRFLPTKDTPRETAIQLLNDIAKNPGFFLDRRMDELVDSATRSWSHRDRGLANALIFGVLRWRERLDWTIRHFSKTPIEKIRPEILTILRLGLFQVFFLDRVPDSAAVHTAVEMAKKYAPPWEVKYVNAVLRNIIRHGGEIPAPDMGVDPALSISVSAAFPRWLIERWMARFGVDETMELCNAHNRIPPITLRANTLRASREELMKKLAGEAASVTPAPYAPDGLCLTGPLQPIQALNAFRQGLFQVQDAGAQLISLMLAPRPGERVLDACAGLGGKTGHIAQLMNNTGNILATDTDPKKLARLMEAMGRLGVTNVETCLCDWSQPAPPRSLGLFDRVLLDAPCSGLGVIRRNPDLKWDPARQDIARFAEKQRLLIRHASRVVKPGGMLVYAVCSVEPEETDDVLATFLDNAREFQLQAQAPSLSPQLSGLLDACGMLRTFPHRHDMDGFFCAVLKKSDENVRHTIGA